MSVTQRPSLARPRISDSVSSDVVGAYASQVSGAAALIACAAAFGCTSEVVVNRSTCVGCHEPGEPGVDGIELAHALFALTCVDCHGGNPQGETRTDAHISNPAGVANLREMATVELDEVDPSYLRFENPSDPRVAAVGCGQQNPAANGSGCHQDLVEASLRGVHSTLVGIITAPRYNAGLQAERKGVFGAIAVEDPDFDPATAPPHSVPELQQISGGELDGLGPQDLPDFLAYTMAKRCVRCHLNVYGGGVDPKEFGNYRASGCAGCHMVYENDGKSRSADPLINKDHLAHPARHTLTTAIPDYQCEHCHWRGNRTGTAYRGWRERPAGSRDVKDNTLRNTSALHTRGVDFFVIDEDTRNDVDETPPDIHFSAGLGCIDCHMGADVHGDGRIHSTMDTEMGMECEDCHGTFDARVTEVDGRFVNTGGDEIRNLSRGETDITLTSLVDGAAHPVTQIADLALSPDLKAAHSTDNHGELECYACHTAWSQNCYGCHTNIDLRGSSRDPINGNTTIGKTAGNRDVVTLDNIHLAINTDGKIGIFMVQNMFFSVIVPCDPRTETASCTIDADSIQPGKKLIDSQVRVADNGRVGFSWGPGVPHTTADKTTVQPCMRCHPKDDGSNLDMVRLTYGFGDGSYEFTDGVSGIRYDLTQMIDEDGTPVVAFAHPGTGPIPIERIRKALETKVP